MKENNILYDINGNPIFFEGNENLKKCGAILPLEEFHINEIIKCSQDIFYFAENYFYILNLDEGMIKIKLRDYQREMIQRYIDNRFNIMMLPRQSGKTVSYAVFVLWYILFNSDKTVAILANKANTSFDILRKIKHAYELLPLWLQQGVKSWNQSRIILENNSEVIASATSSSSIRSKSINVLIIDECAFIPENIWDDFYNSTYPTISSSKTSKVIMISTPNGLNHFYKIWADAEEGRNNFKTFKVHWSQIPGRDEKWKEETIRNLGSEIAFEQEYGNSFLNSSFTLIEKEILRNLVFKEPKDINSLEKFNIIDDKFKRFIKVYEEPKENHIYSIGVDISKMSEEISGDSISIQILDITELPYIQVCSINIKHGIFYLLIPELISNLHKIYNEAYIFIENNDIGQEIANIIAFDYECSNVYFEKPSLGVPGFRTTKKTKRIGCNNLKTFIENKKLILNDYETIFQLSTFIRNKDTYKAEKGYFDDAVMALIASLHFLQWKEFEESSIYTKDFIKKIFEEKEEQYDTFDSIPSSGFFGTDDIY